jgi:hypothetical protein
MKKLVLVLSLLASVSLFGAEAPATKAPTPAAKEAAKAAADKAAIAFTVDAGYNNYYLVNGVVRSEDTPHVGAGVVKSFKYVDAYASAVLLPNDGLDESHWTVGLGKGVAVTKDVTARLDGTVTRHQSTTLENSTEFGVKLTLQNQWLTPYVRGAFDIDLDQNGVYVGVERVQKLPLGFAVTPAFEYGNSTDYQTICLKGTLTRPVATAIGVVTPYVEVGIYDNEFDSGATGFATRELENDVVYSAGFRLSF